MDRGCLSRAAVGFGLVMGGAVVYVLATSETAQVIALAVGMFVIGALIMAVFLTYAVKSIAAGFGSQRNETNYHMLPPGREPGRSDWMMEGPRAEHLLPRLPVGEVVEGEDEFVA